MSSGLQAAPGVDVSAGRGTTGPGARQQEVGEIVAGVVPGAGRRPLAAAGMIAGARAVASRPELWADLVPPAREVRWHALLHRSDAFDVWLLAWDPDHQTDWHDHGGSSGCFAVVSGRLLEAYRRPRSGLAGARTVRAGSAVGFGPAHVHNVSHHVGAPALSIHVYSPPLVAMTYYELTAHGFAARETIRVDSPHGARSDLAETETLSETDRLAISDLLATARRDLPRRPLPAEAMEAVAAGATLVDLRPAEERAAEGEIPGAVAIGRNVLEWRLDPQSDHRIPALARYDAELILFCSEGYASSLAAATLRRMGLSRVTDLDGGYHGWKAAGLPTTA